MNSKRGMLMKTMVIGLFDKRVAADKATGARRVVVEP